MKKKTIANIAMVAIIIAIALAGILSTGHIRGWFDKADENTALLTDFRGIIIIERDGVAYSTTEDTVLRSGDKISCDPGSTVCLVIGESRVTLGQNAKVRIINPVNEEFSVEVYGGEAFIDALSPVTLIFDGKQAAVKEAVATLSVRTGTQSISVYYGTVEGAEAGQMAEWLGEEKLSERSL